MGGEGGRARSGDRAAPDRTQARLHAGRAGEGGPGGSRPMRERGPREPPQQSDWHGLAICGKIWYTDGKVITLLWGRRWRALLDYLSLSGGSILD